MRRKYGYGWGNWVMRCDWRECSLGELITFQRGYDLPKNKMQGGIYPVIGSSGIIGYHNEYTTEAPSITIGRSGNVGKPYLYKGKSWSHNTALYVKEYKNVNPLFIYYFLQTLNLGHYAGGTAVPTLNRNHIHSLSVVIPPLDVQQKIASILSLLDDKIDLNRRINANLEEQARAIWDSWFRSFEPFGGVMPDDWKYATLGDVTENLRERARENNYPVFSVVCSGDLVLSDDFFHKRVYSKDISNYLVVNENNFAYSPPRINIGSIGINDFGYKGCVSPAYVVIKVPEGYEGYFYFYFKSRRFKAESALRASGTVRQTLSYSDFALIEMIYPSREYAEKFNQIYKTVSNAKKTYENETQKLVEIRDSLLPKLISGEIIP